MSSPPPIRTKLLRILLLPLVSMVALWGFIAYSSVDEIRTVSQTQDRWEAIGAPVLQLIVELQRERQLSAEAPGSTAAHRPLADQRRVTDGRVARLREVIGAVAADPDSGQQPEQVRAMVQALDGLQELRASADGGVLAPPLTVIQAYDGLIAVANRQFNDRDVLSDVSSFQAVRGMAAYSTAAEYLGREHAVLTSTIVHRRMTPTDRAAFVAAMTGRRLAFSNAGRDVGPELRAKYDRLVASPAYQRLEAVEDLLFSWDTGGAPPVGALAWRTDAETVLGAINRDTQTELARVQAESEDLKTGAYVRIGLVVLVGLAAVLLSLALSYRFGRSLVDELTRLQGSAIELAEQRLPRLVERLRRGDDVDPATEAPVLEPAGTAEVDRMVEAFSAVRRTAVEAAVGQAALRKGVGQVFLNLARRNQTLLHRQLALLDVMERRVEEPEVLEDLFKLDHLTTRMRRHAENLIILSGASPARRWHDPVPLFDVVRAAVLEVEDYTRVTVVPMQHPALLAGGAVTDVIHLVAELVENAAVFSPPDTTVHVRGMTAANGFAIEVEDRGLGLAEAALAELNARLADPPEFDLADSDRLGLFVVARLAARHGIKVVLRRSPYDGTTAIVLLPSTLLSPAEPAAPAPVLALSAAGPAGRARPPRALGAAVIAPSATDSDAGEPSGPPRAGGVAVASEPQPSTWFEPGPPRRPAPAEPGPSRRPAPTTEPERPGPPAGWSVTVPAHEADEDLDGLPMRIPQASLAPQLRTDARADRRVAGERSPEELARIMASMQRGWQRGRGQTGQEHDARNGKDDHPDARFQK